MGFLNKIDDWTHSGLSKTDDFVNDTVGWETVAAVVANMMGIPMPMSGGEGAAATGFEWLPSGEMTVFNPETAGANNVFIPDLSGESIYKDIGIDPESISLPDTGVINDPAAPYYDYQYSAPTQQRPKMPDFGSQAQQQVMQQLAGLNQGGESGGIRKGQAVQKSILAGLLDPQVALKAYRPTLI